MSNTNTTVKADVYRIGDRVLVVNGRSCHNNQGIWEPADKRPLSYSEVLSIFDYMREEIILKDKCNQMMVDHLLTELGIIKEK